MKKISLILLMTLCLLSVGSLAAQKKPKTPVRRTGRTLVKSIAPPKIETENWQEFESNELSLKLIFPKEPTLSENSYVEFGRFQVKSSIIQSYINTDYYLVEVRQYPADALPERDDLGESYGGWLKKYVLSRATIISEKTVNFGKYKLVEFVYQQSPNEVLIHRALVVGQTLYQIMVQLEIKKPDTLEQTIEKNRGKIDKFFLSFELTEAGFAS